MRARRNLHGFRPNAQQLHRTDDCQVSSLDNFDDIFISAAIAAPESYETGATDACWRRAEALPEGRARPRQQQHLMEVVS
jgi:hypothetical protein